MLKTSKLFVFLSALLFLLVPMITKASLGPGLSKGSLSVPDSYLSDWTKVGVEGGIPDTSNTTLWPVIDTDVTDVSGGGYNCTQFTSSEKSDTASDASKIQCYINYAATLAGSGGRKGTIVKLGTGTFIKAASGPSITLRSNVVLRGAGGLNSATLIKQGSDSTYSNPLITATGATSGATQAISTSPLSIGTTQLAITDAGGITVGDSVKIFANLDVSKVDVTGGYGDHFFQFSKVLAKSGNTITLKTPLAEPINTSLSPRVQKIIPITNAGVEDVKLEAYDGGGTSFWYQTLINFSMVENSWTRRVWYFRSWRHGISMDSSWNNTVEHCQFDKSLWNMYGGGEAPYDSYMVQFADGATQNLAVNNVVNGLISFAVLTHAGAYRNVYAYNYIIPDISNRGQGLSFHGWYPYENLYEGNDANSITHDDWWGKQGPRNVLYRNRLRPDSGQGIFRAETRWDRNTNGVSAQQFSWINNSAYAWMSTPFCSYPNCINYFTESYNGWAEKNTFRDPTIASEPWQGRGFVGCANPNGPGTPNDVGIGNTCVDLQLGNQGPPTAWAGVNFPASFWTVNKPSWWCDETPWPAIGANIDNFTNNPANLIKLPAQRWFEGLPCTTSGGTVVTPPTDNPPSFSSFSISPTTVTVNSSVTFSASVSDDHGVSGVQFYVNGNTQGNEVTSSPYTLSYSPTVAGTYSITARARDSIGQTTNSNSVTLTVNSVITPPVTPPSGCTISTTLWQNIPFTSQSTPFTAEFDVTPTQAGLDAITGLSTSPASAYTDLAILIRFGGGSGQYIEARNGIPYSATNPMTYSIGSTYHFRVVVNPTSNPTPVAKSFTVYVRPPGGTEQLLASNFAFRDSQSNTATFSNLGIISEPIGHQVCNFTVTTNSQTGGLSSLSFSFSTDTNLSLSGKAMTVSILPQGSTKTTLALETQTPTASYQGSTNQITLPTTGRTPGSYDVQIKAPGTLSRKQTFTLASGSTYTFSNKLISGDINNDNAINALDWSMMSPDWFQTNKFSDINGDGITNALDFTWLNRNWFLIGE